MLFQTTKFDERTESNTRYAAALWLGVTQILLAGVLFYRLYVLGQPDEPDIDSIHLVGGSRAAALTIIVAGAGQTHLGVGGQTDLAGQRFRADLIEHRRQRCWS